jgi:hypothetical protein
MTDLSRRLMLGGVSAATLLAAVNTQARPVHGGVAASGGGGLPNLVATVTFPGGSPAGGPFTYDIANGIDMGSYIAPTAGFTQRCIRVRNAGLANFFVDFRPDLSGGRIEAVFWNGEVLGTVASSTFRNLPAYTVAITLNGVTQSEVYRGSSSSIPYHYWGNRWRWQSALRSVIRTPSQVFSGSFLPNMSLSAARLTGYSGVIVPTAASIPTPSNNNGKNGDGSAMTSGTAYGYAGYLYQFPMIADSLSARLWGISCGGDDGGFRDEEGLITKWQADWLLNSTASSLNTFMQQAEFFSSQVNAMFLPDQIVGGPINQKSDLDHYTVSTNNFYGSYYKAVNGGYGLALSSGGFNGSYSGTTLTVSSSPSHPIQPNMVVKDYSNNGTTYGTLLPGTYIVTQLTGTPGDTGTYQLSQSQSGTSPTQMLCFGTTGEYQSKGDEHSPQAWYLPWVITEDPYYIEGAQFHETFALQADIYYKENTIGNLAGDATGASGINGAFTLPPSNPGTGEERGGAWCVKNIASCYKMSPSSPPSWLLSSGYWGTVSSDVSTFIDWIQSNWATDQFYTVFHSFSFASGSDTPQTFYKAYGAYCFGFADLVGLPVPAASGHSAPTNWKGQLTYMFDFIRKITDSTLASGWNVQSPLIHDTEPPTWMSNQGGSPSGCTVGDATHRPTGTNCAATYAQFWTYAGTYTQDSSPYPSNPSPGLIGSATSAGNLGPLIAAIAVAKSRAITGAANCFTWINSMIDYSYPQAGYNLSFNQQDAFDGT